MKNKNFPFKNKNVDKLELVAKIITFLIFLYVYNVAFPIFNSTNFQDLELDISSQKNSSGNLINQLYWLVILYFDIYLVSKNFHKFTQSLKENYILILLCLLMIISVLWSNAPVITFRRSILECIVIISVIISCSYIRDLHKIIDIIITVSSLALILNLYSWLLGIGFDLEGYFKGIHGHKNALGPIASVTIYVLFLKAHITEREISKFKMISLSILWSMFLFISVSKTSIALFILCPLIVLIYIRLNNLFRNRALGIIISFTMFLFSSLFLYLTISDDKFIDILSIFVSDTSFTGRDDIWMFMFNQISERPFLGYGYGAFWGIGYDSINIIKGDGFIQLLNQGHNGYIDLLANLGMLGFSLYALLILNTLLNLDLSTSAGVIKKMTFVILAFTIIHNFTESSLLRGYSFLWVIQLYFLCISKKIR